MEQFSNVGAPVSNERLVLQLISGLIDAYATIGSQIRHSDTLPPFYKARSMIILEETARAKKAAITPDNVGLIASHTDAPTATSFNRTNRGGGNNNHGRGGSGRGHHGLYHCTNIHNNNGLIYHMITKINNGIFKKMR